MASSPISISLLRDGEDARWDEFVRAAPEGTFFHLSGWKRVIERAFRHRTLYLMAERGGVVVGVLPLTQIKIPLLRNSLISNAFQPYGGPVAADAEARAALDAEALRIRDELGASYLEFRSIVPQRPDWARKQGVYATFRKPIHPEVAANLKAIPRKQRAMVRKGMANGLRSEVDDDVSRFYDVYATSVRNLGTPVFSKGVFLALKQEFGSSCDIVTILKGDEAVASVMNFYFRDEVLPYYGGGTEAARHLAGNDFMYWEVMRRACERGYRTFDFGRSKVGTGAFDFKRYWGFEPTPLVYEYHLKAGATVPNVSPLNPKFRAFVSMWRHLPLPIAKLLGPMVVRYLD